MFEAPAMIGPDGTVTLKTRVEFKLLNVDKESGKINGIFKFCLYTVNPDGSVKQKRYYEEDYNF